MTHTIVAIVSFVILAISSERIGRWCGKIKLPLITGFLLTGIVAGPFLLGMISQETVRRLHFVDQLSLAIIAFAAGNELHVQSMRSRMKSITWVMGWQVVAVFGLGSLGIFLLSGWLPFMSSLPAGGRFGISLLAGAILLARSPSSAIAIVNELRAKGPFTQTALGVTMLTDVVVIVLFAISFSIAQTLLANRAFDLSTFLLLGAELLLAFVLSVVVKYVLEWAFSLHVHRYFKRASVMLLGYGVFALATYIHHWSLHHLPFALHLEPLLICMLVGFLMTNFGKYKDDFSEKIHKIAPPIYIAFFTLTGASLGLDLLLKVWPIALALVAIRLAAMFVGSWLGGTFAGDPQKHNRLSWMVYVTQAGVGLGLAKEVAGEFPVWGPGFATLIISVIIVNQLVGPPFFKWAIEHVKEAHPRANEPTFDGQRDAVLFGLDGRTVAVARQLRRHHWTAQIVTISQEQADEVLDDEIPFHYMPELTLENLRNINLEKADAVVMMLPDEENEKLSELVYEHFGTKTMVALLRDREKSAYFRDLGVLTVEQDTAMVNLFDHLIRSPLGTSFLLDSDQEREDLVDFVVRDPALHGLALRELKLPPDVLILSVVHKGKKLVSHGYTQIEVGDHVTVIGSPESLEIVELLFEKTAQDA